MRIKTMDIQFTHPTTQRRLTYSMNFSACNGPIILSADCWIINDVIWHVIKTIMFGLKTKFHFPEDLTASIRTECGSLLTYPRDDQPFDVELPKPQIPFAEILSDHTPLRENFNNYIRVLSNGRSMPLRVTDNGLELQLDGAWFPYAESPVFAQTVIEFAFAVLLSRDLYKEYDSNPHLFALEYIIHGLSNEDRRALLGGLFHYLKREQIIILAQAGSSSLRFIDGYCFNLDLPVVKEEK